LVRDGRALVRKLRRPRSDLCSWVRGLASSSCRPRRRPRPCSELNALTCPTPRPVPFRVFAWHDAANTATTSTHTPTTTTNTTNTTTTSNTTCATATNTTTKTTDHHHADHHHHRRRRHRHARPTSTTVTTSGAKDDLTSQSGWWALVRESLGNVAAWLISITMHQRTEASEPRATADVRHLPKAHRSLGSTHRKCTCVHACVGACVCACACVRACWRVCVCVCVRV
jgi:hypothetical protein